MQTFDCKNSITQGLGAEIFFANIDRVTVFQPSRSMPTNTLFHNFGIVLSYFQAQCVDRELFFNVQFT